MGASIPAATAIVGITVLLAAWGLLEAIAEAQDAFRAQQEAIDLDDRMGNGVAASFAIIGEHVEPATGCRNLTVEHVGRATIDTSEVDVLVDGTLLPAANVTWNGISGSLVAPGVTVDVVACDAARGDPDALSTDEGAERWRRDLGGDVGNLSDAERIAHTESAGSVAVRDRDGALLDRWSVPGDAPRDLAWADNGSLLVSTDGGTLEHFDAGGTLLSNTSAVTAPGGIAHDGTNWYVTNEASGVEVLDADLGATTTWATSSAAVDVAVADGTVYALLADGSTVRRDGASWTTLSAAGSTGTPTALAAGRHLAVLDGDGEIELRSPSDGALLSTIADLPSTGLAGLSAGSGYLIADSDYGLRLLEEGDTLRIIDPWGLAAAGTI